MKDVDAMLKEIRLEWEDYAKVDVLLKGSSPSPLPSLVPAMSATTSTTSVFAQGLQGHGNSSINNNIFVLISIFLASHMQYAHRDCVQRWCNKKGDIICEIFHEAFHNLTPNFHLLSPFLLFYLHLFQRNGTFSVELSPQGSLTRELWREESPDLSSPSQPNPTSQSSPVTVLRQIKGQILPRRIPEPVYHLRRSDLSSEPSEPSVTNRRGSHGADPVLSWLSGRGRGNHCARLRDPIRGRRVATQPPPSRISPQSLPGTAEPVPGCHVSRRRRINA
ncbi:hypothetical protein IEQ34_004402 [Dendrobium chrysotoxum]|uniref:Uncharacterized protein n=1 Tax=Dendrobium chrysotoxum TaxID=161865 RepID=A0AAV7HH50_DENCH|nr:hypothetical protein IEQ34_004402 [Dendrobium chrysotoxum]